MNVPKQQSLFFITVPELHKLCATRITLKNGIGEPEVWSKVLKLCRQLLFLYQDILIAPVPGILSEIWIVMAISFYKSGKLDAYFEKYEAKMETTQTVLPVVLQNCLSFTLTAKLAPSWNRAGHLLVQGKEFLSQMGKLNAIALDINVAESQICLSVEAYMIRLPPPQIEDFAVPQNVITEFYNDKNAVIEGHSILNNWCYVLPSMKMGQIRSVLHMAPPNCPFHSFEDFQKHWNHLYGYKLPEEYGDINTQVYCSVHFKMMGGRTFTYPLSCIRSQPVQFFPRVDMEDVLKSFFSDLKTNLPHICGFPIKITSQPCYYTVELTRPQIQENKVKPPNLTTNRMLGPSVTQVTPTLAPSLVQCSIAKGHQVELLAGQPKPPEPAAPPAQREGLAPGRADPAGPGNTQPSPLSNTSPKFVPIFKNQLLQVNASVLEPGNQKRKQQVVTESSLSSPTASTVQGDVLNLHPAIKKIATYTIEMNARSVSHRASVPQQENNACGKRGQHLPSNGRLSAVGVAEGSQPPQGTVPSQSVDGKKCAANPQVNEKRNFTSKYITQVLGEDHMSLKIKRRPHIFESDTEPEEPQPLPPQPVAQVNQVDRSEHRSMESQAAHRSKRKLGQEPSRASKKPHPRPTLCAQCRISKRQGLHSEQTKSKKPVTPKT
ncbi:uncharacterized protein C18orf63 homolog [Sorex araneus]|uniref:uncharacterized protein C18orf63 homolog n=1 Tax=Sorex araneus TaxID=42254 RepID=UPI002433BF4C|nr:uncharacterized protein C18orf63 homolog [Sorex araneus]